MGAALQAKLVVFERLHPKGIDLSLSRMARLLQALGDPHLNLPPVIHVAGTNGKGSTLAFCHAICEAAALRVHKYISPHLVTLNERITLSGKLITDEALIALLDEVERVNQGNPITFFEAITAAAFLAFARTPADIVLLETGLGGELDATNVVPNPAATAITPISWDHAQILGPTLVDIANAKAGIIKSNVPVIVSAQPPGVLQVIEARATQLSAPLWRFGREWNLTCLPHVPLGLAGDFQRMNAATAVWLLTKQQAVTIPPPAVEEGLAKAHWPGRLHKVANPYGADVWMDGAHNVGGVHALMPTLQTWRRQKPLCLIMAIKEDKAALEMLTLLQPVADFIFFVPCVHEDAHFYQPEVLYAMAQNKGIPCAVAPSFPRIMAQHDPTKRYLALGSLYFCGEILQMTYD
jgi:dihydrofolate synthase/folylpolyglutamate synthase